VKIQIVDTSSTRDDTRIVRLKTTHFGTGTIDFT